MTTELEPNRTARQASYALRFVAGEPGSTIADVAEELRTSQQRARDVLLALCAERLLFRRRSRPSRRRGRPPWVYRATRNGRAEAERADVVGGGS